LKTTDNRENTASSLNPLYGKRIIFVLFSFELGGAERQALYLARYLKNVHQAHVEVWAFCNPDRLIEICDEFQIKWKLVPVWSQFTGWQIIFSVLRLGLALRAAKPDFLLPYMTPANIYCGLAWRFTGAKCCIWNQRNAGHTIYNLVYEIRAAHKVSALVANSKLGADFMVSTYSVPKEKVHGIHNGVELSSPKTDKKRVRDYYKISEDNFIACMVDNLNSNKDYITLLKAWALVTNRLERRACLLLAVRDDSAYAE
jgi:glycosyltransferase involved in cell wall biosynthesis